MFDWDRFNTILAPDGEIPPNSITATDYASRCNMTRQGAFARLLQLEKKGEIKSVKVKGDRYFYFEDGADDASV